MRRPSPLVLAGLAVAVALLVAGLAGPAKRAWQERERARHAEAIARERADAEARFLANRETILAEMRGLVDAGDYAGALRLAAPYGDVRDPAWREIFREAATAESHRQRGELYASLVGERCNEAYVRQRVSEIFGALPKTVARPSPPDRVFRLEHRDARERVLTRMREPSSSHRPKPGNTLASQLAVPSSASQPAPDWVVALRDAHRAQLLPDYLGFVLSPKAAEVVCVFRAEGERDLGSRRIRYALDLWVAPATDLKGVTADLAAYGEYAP